MKKIKLFFMELNLNKKLIVTVLLKDLTKAAYLLKVRGISQSAITNGALVPTLNPIPGDFKPEVDTLETLMTESDNLMQQLKSKTEEINVQQNKIRDILTDKWAPTIETTPGITVDNVKLLGFGIKGIDDQQGEDPVSVTNSHPVNGDIEYSHLAHTFTARNSTTGKIAIPKDALHTEVREQIGGTEPTDYKKMPTVGRMVRGKYTSHFDSEHLGQTAYYFLIYVPRNPDNDPEIGGIFKATII